MKNFFLILIYFIFFVIIGPIVIVATIQQSIFSSSDFIKNTARDINIYERLTDIKASDLSQTINPENRDPKSQIPEETLQNIIDSVSPQILQNTTEKALDGVFENAKTGNPDLIVDLTEIKTAIIKNQPPEISAEFDKAIPNTYEFKFSDNSTPVWQFISSVFAKYFGIALLVFMFLLSILLAEGWRSKFRVTSALFMEAGIILITIYYAVSSLPLEKMTSKNDAALSQNFTEILKDFLIKIQTILEKYFLFEASVALALFAIFFGLSFLFHKKITTKEISQEKPEINSPAPTPNQPTA